MLWKVIAGLIWFSMYNEINLAKNNGSFDTCQEIFEKIFWSGLEFWNFTDQQKNKYGLWNWFRAIKFRSSCWAVSLWTQYMVNGHVKRIRLLFFAKWGYIHIDFELLLLEKVYMNMCKLWFGYRWREIDFWLLYSSQAQRI